MGDKYIALLLVFHVVVACVEAETFEEKQKACSNYCTQACIYPQTFCQWWCNGRCQNPALCDSLAKETGPKEYPVPTEENYKDYLSTPPPSPPSKKNEVHPKLVAVDEPNNDL